MGYRKGYYRKNGTYVQGHFTNNRSRSFSGKNNGCVLLILVFIMLTSIISCSDSADDISNSGSNSNSSSGSNSDSNSGCPTKTCASFKTRAEAQAVYDSNRKCYKNLDADGDGRACESLK